MSYQNWLVFILLKTNLNEMRRVWKKIDGRPFQISACVSELRNKVHILWDLTHLMIEN